MSAEAQVDPVAGVRTMLAVRLQAPGGTGALAVEQIAIPRPAAGEALIRVYAAAITRDELDWPTDRLPATPSYELSGVVAATGQGAADLTIGAEVYGLTGFDRDGVAAEYAVVPAAFLAPKPRTIGHAESAALPMPALTAWQGLFVHGGLEAGERVLILGAAGGVGHVATQLARWRGAHVIGTASGGGVEAARGFGAHQAIDPARTRLDEAVEPVDLVFDTVGGEVQATSAAVLREGGRLVSVAEAPPSGLGAGITGTYFVVEPDRRQLVELAALVDQGAVRSAIDSVFPLADARAAFQRVLEPGKRGKVVLEVIHD